MAERLTGPQGCRGFGSGQGTGLVAVALLAVILLVPMASIALTIRNMPAAQDGGPGLRTSLGRQQAAVLEKHIATLHRTLHVTPTQEPLWLPLASAMRRNVTDLDEAYAQREKLHGSISAVDDLKSYATVQQIRARNVQNLIGPFQALYESFTPSQKRDADDTLRSFTDNAVRNSR